MLTYLGWVIEKKPWFVVTLVILVTIGFSMFIPSLEFRTDFRDFNPDDELVRAHLRIFDYFGMSQQIMYLYVERDLAESTITPQALREIDFLQKELARIPDVNGTLAITMFIDNVCQVEFGRTLENCTDRQIQTALHDLLMKPKMEEEVRVLNVDDPNEPYDFKRILSKGKSIDSVDVKNCYISKDNETMMFSIEVYDLSHFQSSLKPSLPMINVMEWYIEFENLIIPDERLDIEYRIAAHIEPTHPLWTVGAGFLDNIRAIFQHIRNKELFSSYKKEVLLWVRPPGQTMFFPIPLETGNITFDTSLNRVNILVSRDELRRLGIAPYVGTFELPAKLTNFSAGVRYFKIPGKLFGGGRIEVNTSFLLERVDKIQERPIIGAIASRILQKYGEITWEDFNELFDTMEQYNMVPETIALKDIENTWIQSDTAPDEDVSNTIFFILPAFFKEIQVNALSFLSKDYEQTGSPRASLIVLKLNYGEVFEDTLEMNRRVTKQIEMLDEKFKSVSVETTGEGVVSLQINEVTSEANQLIAPSIFIIIMSIMFINFRRTSYVILPMLALGVSTTWLFGTMALLGIPFNVIAVALIPLIVGLGVDYSVHLFHNYRAELEKGRPPAEAIKRSVKDIGTAMFLAMITTVIAFMSFLSATIPPIRDFGVLLAIGVTYTFITAITLLAAARYLLDRGKKIRFKRRLRFFSVRNIMGKTSQLVLRHPKKILIIMILVSLVMAAGAVRIEKGFDMEQFIPENNPALLIFEKIAEDFPYVSQDQEYILIEGDVATVEALKGIAETHKNLEDDTYVSRNIDGTVRTTSIYTVIQKAIRNNQTLLTRFNIDETGIPRTDEDVYKLYEYLYWGDKSKDSDVGSLSRFEARNVLFQNNSRYESAIIRVFIDSSFQLKEGSFDEELEVIKNELNEDIETYGEATAIATGNFIITLAISNSLTYSQIISTSISLILAALVIIIVYRNFLLGLIAMIPVGISIIWILGSIYYLGYILNVMTVTVTCITIGIGIDYAIHATERFRLVADKTGDISKAVYETISHTGGALFIAALTTVCGFGILVFAPIPPQQQFGFIIAITIIYSFLTSVLILPLMLAKWAKWRKKRKGYIISPKVTENE